MTMSMSDNDEKNCELPAISYYISLLCRGTWIIVIMNTINTNLITQYDTKTTKHINDGLCSRNTVYLHFDQHFKLVDLLKCFGSAKINI